MTEVTVPTFPNSSIPRTVIHLCRACFQVLPRILCFNTMRYAFNMVTMMKEKVNTHFSFPLQLNMAPYTEDFLMGDKQEQGTIWNEIFTISSWSDVCYTGALASWLVGSSPDRVVWVRALVGDIALCSWARHFTLTLLLVAS